MFISTTSTTSGTAAVTIISKEDLSPPLTPLQTSQPFSIKKSAEAEDLSVSPSSSPSGKLPSWLGFLYQRTSSNATFPSTQPTKKVDASATGKKGILKKPKPIDYDALERLSAEQVIIQKSATLTPKEIRKLTLASATPKSPTSLPTTEPATAPATEPTTLPESDPLSSKKPRQRLCRFSSLVQVGEAHSKEEYDRGAVEYIAKSLTPALALAIKRELNEVKSEMPVHQDSAIYTQFYPIPSNSHKQSNTKVAEH